MMNRTGSTRLITKIMETNNKTILLSLSGVETDLNQRVVIETEAKDPERISSSVSISVDDGRWTYTVGPLAAVAIGVVVVVALALSSRFSSSSSIIVIVIILVMGFEL